MKKFAIYGLAAMLGFSFVACDNYDEPNPQPQTNPQEPIFQASDVTVSNDLTSEVYDLTELEAAFENIKVATIKAAELPVGCTLAANVEISVDDFETSFPVASSSGKVEEEEAYNVFVSPADLEEVYFENISKAPTESELKVRILAKTVIGTQEAIVGGPDNFYGPYLMKIKPMSRASYLYTPGAANNWNQENSQRLYGYDTVNYMGYALLSDGGFKFSSEPNWEGTNYGAGDAEGTLSTDGDASNLTVPAYGLYFCNVDVEALTYSVTNITTIGVIGDSTPKGWDASTPLTSTDYLIWTGTVEFKEGEFKFRANDNWDVNLGGSLKNLEQGEANLPSPGVGTYEVTLDLSQLPYTCTLVKK